MSLTEFGPIEPALETVLYRPVASPLKVILIARDERTGEEFADDVEEIYGDAGREPVTLWGRQYKLFDWLIVTDERDLPEYEEIDGDEGGVLLVEVDSVASMSAFSERGLEDLTLAGASRTTAATFLEVVGLYS